MARSEGVPVIKLHLDKEQVDWKSIGAYLKALFEAMKTKPKAAERRSPTTGGGRAEGHDRVGR